MVRILGRLSFLLPAALVAAAVSAALMVDFHREPAPAPRAPPPGPMSHVRHSRVSPAIARAILAARNGSGTYSLPAGNPVVTGTLISSSWANNTLADLATEMSDSLDRSGKGGMLAPLQLTAGTVGNPAIYFGTDSSTGLYRGSANNPRMSVTGTDMQTWSVNASSFPATTVTMTGVSGTNALTVNGVAAGAISATAGLNNTAIAATGNGSGAGIVCNGGATGQGISCSGGGNNEGGAFFAGTGALAGTRRASVTLNNGDLSMAGVVNPNTNLGLTNWLTPAAIPKAYGVVTTAGGSSTTCTVTNAATQGSLNVASCVASNALGNTIANGTLTVTLTNSLTSAFAAAAIAVHGFQGTDGAAATTVLRAQMTDASHFNVVGDVLNPTGPTITNANCFTNVCTVQFVVFGNQ